MKTILCYGDSNTWGYIPGNNGRYPREKRWPSVLQRMIGAGFYVIEEGLCGRYTVHDEPFRVGRNGAALLQPILETHAPVNLLILFLGTNDLLHHVDITALDAARGIEVLAKIAQSSETGPLGNPPKILIISPPRIRKLSTELSQLCHGEPSKSVDFTQFFREIANERSLFFLDAAEILEPSPLDGVHLDEDAHLVLGRWKEIIIQTK
ncbi:SGNH/GDSL hydrolase family protein [Methyloprofundus sp.]|uniref:SGNH/GDSL hydrolase family protein n=1 Tax=Methyloprofundus sp. TaxID=2020875 RepID=UPI003D1109A3